MVIARPEDGQPPCGDLVHRFWYTTSLLGARYRLDLACAAVRMDLTLTAPYVLSIAHTWQRVACSNVDYTQLLERTDRALQDLDVLGTRLHDLRGEFRAGGRIGDQRLLSHLNDLGNQTEYRGEGLSRLTRSAELSCNDGGDAGIAKRCGKVLSTLEPGFAQRSIRL